MESRDIRIMLQTFRYIYGCDTFKIHRDFIADYFGITVASVAQYMKGLLKKGVISLKATSVDKLYTVILIQNDGYILTKMKHNTKEDLDNLTNEWIEKYNENHQQTYYNKDTNIKYDTLENFLKAKRQEQIDRENKVELKLIAVFDELCIDYDYQHIEIIKDDEGKEHGYIYDFLVEIEGKKYDVEVDGSSHNDREEQDKERDDLSKSIGIEPRRLPTQMIYEIEYEVRRGLLSKSDLLWLIVNNFTSIKLLWYSVTHWYNKFNEFEPELNILLKKLSEVELSIRNDTEEKKRFIVEFESNIKKANEIVEFEISKRNEKIKELEDEISKRNDTIKNLEEKIKNEDEISSMFDAAEERHRKDKDEMPRECFLLSKKNV